ncbi:3D domain-containing protein [Fusibacter sp. 3D3]|uniref:3D domain-containing protein n=1 Tax=Fusibacter sp. 3D3 TaxID=1048380 RepID=UPI0008585499|nr:3D domain-containing protein [Fusibacter sp. 3D3]GAU76332.1 cell wall-binding protein [Fusibacter sp. 3D3]
MSFRGVKSLLLLVIFGLVIIFGIKTVFKHKVVIIDEDKIITISTFENKIPKILKLADINLRTEDRIEPNLDEAIGKDSKIVIQRAKPITLVEGETQTILYSTENKVSAILESAGITLGNEDQVYPRLNDAIARDRLIEIVRVKVSYETISEKIPYNTVYKMTDSKLPGDREILSEGKDGALECKFKIVYENGVEVSRQMVTDRVVVVPETEIIEEGLDKLYVTSRGMPFRYRAVIIMRATAYDLSYESCGKNPGDPGYGITRSGTRARPGAVAVDPKVIDLGSKLYVESLDGTLDYGFASAEDTGSAIKGNRIDLFISNRAQALRYGTRNVRVYVLDEKIPEEMFVGYSKK